MNLALTGMCTQESPVSGRVFSQLVYFSRHEDEEVQLKSATGLGFYCVRHPEMMLETATRELYLEWLVGRASSKKKCQVLKNLQSHLKEVETTLKVADMHGRYRTEDTLCVGIAMYTVNFHFGKNYSS